MTERTQSAFRRVLALPLRVIAWPFFITFAIFAGIAAWIDPEGHDYGF